MSKPEVKDDSLGQCVETQCKHKSVRLNFCTEHYAQAKFGVIRMNGTRPVDYDRKMGHYEKNKTK